MLQGSCSLALVKHIYYFVFTDALTCHTCCCWRAVPPSQGQPDTSGRKGSTFHKQTIRTEATASSEKLLHQVMTPGSTSICPSYLRGQTTGVSADIQQPIGTIHISQIPRLCILLFLQSQQINIPAWALPSLQHLTDPDASYVTMPCVLLLGV